MQPHALNDHTWRKASVTRKVGIRLYEVEADGHTFILNQRHLRKVSSPQNNEVEEQPVDQNTVNQLSNSCPSGPTRVMETNDPVTMEHTMTALPLAKLQLTTQKSRHEEVKSH